MAWGDRWMSGGGPARAAAPHVRAPDDADADLLGVRRADRSPRHAAPRQRRSHLKRPVTTTRTSNDFGHATDSHPRPAVRMPPPGRAADPSCAEAINNPVASRHHGRSCGAGTDVPSSKITRCRARQRSRAATSSVAAKGCVWQPLSGPFTAHALDRPELMAQAVDVASRRGPTSCSGRADTVHLNVLRSPGDVVRSWRTPALEAAAEGPAQAVSAPRGTNSTQLPSGSSMITSRTPGMNSTGPHAVRPAASVAAADHVVQIVHDHREVAEPGGGRAPAGTGCWPRGSRATATA